MTGLVPASLELRSKVTVAHWRPPYDQRALRELMVGMEAAVAEADRLMRFVPAQFRCNIEIRPMDGSYNGWDIRVIGREPYTDEEPE